MTDYWDLLTGSKRPSYYSGGNPFRLWHSAMDHLYETSHGKTRYWLSQLPLTGRARQLDSTAERWEDSYNNTGIDPQYSDSYGGAGRSFFNDMTGGIPNNPVKMSRTLAKMYGADVALDVAKLRFSTAVESRRAAQSWQQYERMRSNRSDY